METSALCAKICIAFDQEEKTQIVMNIILRHDHFIVVAL
jgi:hypothetical protein